MDYHSISIFLNEHIICYGQYETKLKFPICGINRYQIDKVTDKVPRKVRHYILICMEEK
jgi:hypothetical protein